MYNTLLKVVVYYDLSVLSMSVVVSKKKSLDGFETYPICLGFLEFFKLCKAPNCAVDRYYIATTWAE